MMTTLHGLVTISELFQAFNLINTGVVTCELFNHVSECTQNAPFRGKKIQKFSGEGAQPPQTPPPRRLDTRSTCPPNESPGSASVLYNMWIAPYIPVSVIS